MWHAPQVSRAGSAVPHAGLPVPVQSVWLVVSSPWQYRFAHVPLCVPAIPGAAAASASTPPYVRFVPGLYAGLKRTLMLPTGTFVSFQVPPFT